jgi:hypothetical protein
MDVPDPTTLEHPLKNINIERYEHPSIASEWAGLVEGVRDDGTTWILFLDDHGSPALYWAERDLDGGVIGDPVILDSATHSTAGWLHT